MKKKWQSDWSHGIIPRPTRGIRHQLLLHFKWLNLSAMLFDLQIGKIKTSSKYIINYGHQFAGTSNWLQSEMQETQSRRPVQRIEFVLQQLQWKHTQMGKRASKSLSKREEAWHPFAYTCLLSIPLTAVANSLGGELINNLLVRFKKKKNQCMLLWHSAPVKPEGKTGGKKPLRHFSIVNSLSGEGRELVQLCDLKEINDLMDMSHQPPPTTNPPPRRLGLCYSQPDWTDGPCSQ